MGTISFIELYVLYLDIFWCYLSQISSLCRWRKPEGVEKNAWVRILHSALKERVIGTISFIALYADSRQARKVRIVNVGPRENEI